jgi:hypothetical protein
MCSLPPRTAQCSPHRSCNANLLPTPRTHSGMLAPRTHEQLRPACFAIMAPRNRSPHRSCTHLLTTTHSFRRVGTQHARAVSGCSSSISDCLCHCFTSGSPATPPAAQLPFNFLPPPPLWRAPVLAAPWRPACSRRMCILSSCTYRVTRRITAGGGCRPWGRGGSGRCTVGSRGIQLQ